MFTVVQHTRVQTLEQSSTSARGFALLRTNDFGNNIHSCFIPWKDVEPTASKKEIGRSYEDRKKFVQMLIIKKIYTYLIVTFLFYTKLRVNYVSLSRSRSEGLSFYALAHSGHTLYVMSRAIQLIAIFGECSCSFWQISLGELCGLALCRVALLSHIDLDITVLGLALGARDRVLADEQGGRQALRHTVDLKPRRRVDVEDLDRRRRDWETRLRRAEGIGGQAITAEGVGQLQLQIVEFRYVRTNLQAFLALVLGKPYL